MQLVNTEGMAFIGPGSEWFWTALTGLVLAVTFVGIYRQLSIARSATAREQIASFNREWASERMIVHRLAVMVALRDGADPAYLPEGSPGRIAGYWEAMGGLARGGHLDPKLMHDSGPGGACEVWWKVLAPYVRRLRTEESQPGTFGNFEWYAGINAEFNRRGGATIDDAWLAHHRDGLIRSAQNWLRVEQSLRTVIVASPEAMPATPATAPPAAAKAEG